MALPLQNYFNPATPATEAPFANRDYNQMLQTSLDFFSNPNSQLRQQARQEGLNMAAERGGINSSIAAGASERAALGQAVPLAQSAIASQLGQEQATLNNWLDSQGFNRQMAALPYQNSLSMLNTVSQFALQDPQLYAPSVVSGFNNFFNQNMNDILSRYFES